MFKRVGIFLLIFILVCLCTSALAAPDDILLFTLDETAARMGTTRTTARSAEQKGLRLLRHPRNSQRLKIYR